MSIVCGCVNAKTSYIGKESKIKLIERSYFKSYTDYAVFFNEKLVAEL